jgi:hypothetical protein
MRPAIKAGLRMVWRDRDTLQIGIDPRRAVALTGMRGAAGLINLLDGSREHGQVLAAAGELGIPAVTADRIIGLLAAAGALADFPATALRGQADGPRSRLAGELATASLAHGYTDGGASVLARRQAAAVRVYGVGPVGSAIASLLTAAGVGYVAVTGPVSQPAAQPPLPARPPIRRPRPGGPPGRRQASEPQAADRRRAQAAERPRAQAADRQPAGPGWQTDLAILAGSYRPELPAKLLGRRITHLAVAASEAIGVVGPLVIPAETACLTCIDLVRTDRDPAWPLILAQTAGHDTQPAACDTTLAAAVAAQATAQALAFLDRTGPGEVVRNGTLELVLPGWQWRRRSWLPHQRCHCGAGPARR